MRIIFQVNDTDETSWISEDAANEKRLAVVS